MFGRYCRFVLLFVLLGVLLTSAKGQDPRQIKGNLFGYYEPRSSFPGGIKQALAGLGYFQSTDRAMRKTEVTQSTVENVTFQSWPLTNGLLPQPWVARGIPSVYAPAIEPPEIEQPEFQDKLQFEKIEFDSWGFPEKLGGEAVHYQRVQFEQRTVMDPLFVRAQFDQRVTSERALRRFMVLTNGSYPGGIFHLSRNESVGMADPFVAPSRLRNDALTDVFDRTEQMRRKPRWGAHLHEDNWRTETGAAVSSTVTWQPRRDRHNSGRLDLQNFQPAYGARQNFTKDHYMPLPGGRNKGF